MQKYSSERELLDDMLGLPSRPAPPVKPNTNDKMEKFNELARRVQVAEEPERVMPGYDVDAKAEEIARLFEDPDRTPNMVVFRQPDDQVPKPEWCKAAKRAGVLLHHKVRTHTNSLGRTMAILEPHPHELEAERQRMSEVMHAVLTGEPKPPPLPRNWR